MNRLQKFITELFQTLFSLVKIALLSKYFVSFKNYKVTKEDCVILGNGPCLKRDFELNKDFIAERKKICVNLFAFSDEYSLVKPDYYVLAAPEFWMKYAIDFHIQQRSKLADDILGKTNWPLKMLLPFTSKNSDFINKIKSNKNISIIYYNTTPIEGLRSIINFLFKSNLGMPRPHNVLIPSIYLAINLGFKKVFIFGADHSWHEEIKVDENNLMTVNHQHFYEKKEVRMPMYKLDGKNYFMHDLFRKLHLAFKGYFILGDYAEYRNVKILNASSKSFIDAFEKVKL